MCIIAVYKHKLLLMALKLWLNSVILIQVLYDKGLDVNILQNFEVTIGYESFFLLLLLFL